jgi:hypothetical protein
MMSAEASLILAAGRPAPSFDITEKHLRPLPEPVQQYLRAAGVVGSPSIRTVWLQQEGFFRRGQKWLPLRAEQSFATDPPGFAWQAKIRFLPLLNFSVTDMFFNGHGRLHGKLLSWFKVVDASGPEADQGELLRYLTEMALFPTAWPSPYIEWESIDGRSARATLRLPSVAVSAVIHFDDQYNVCRVTAQRHMEEDGGFVLRQWSGQFSDYQRIHGLLIPVRASASWQLDSGDREYFRGEVTRIEYDV